MPVLKNPKHERFAQELAKGLSAAEAYVKAGYEYNNGNCIRLKGNESIQERVAELHERAAKTVDITIGSLTAMYLEDHKLAKELGQASAAKGCLDSLAKLHGFMIDRKETGGPGDFARMTDDELDRFISSREDRVGRGQVGADAQGESAGMRGLAH